MNTSAPEQTALARQRTLLVASTLALNAVWMVTCTQLPFSDWRTAAGLIAVDLTVLVGFALIKRDVLLGKLLLFGLLLGTVELSADAYLADAAKTVDFSLDGGSPRLWSSPIYMPFAWQVVGVQIGVLSLWLHALWPQRGVLLAGLFGAACMPAYEELARINHWWRYSNCRMLHATPWHEIVAYVAIMLAIAASAPFLSTRRSGWLWAAALGSLNGLLVLVAFAVTHRLIG